MVVPQRSSRVVLNCGLSCCRKADLQEERDSESDPEPLQDTERRPPLQLEGASLASAFSPLHVTLHYTDLHMCFCQTRIAYPGKAAVGRSSKKRWRSISVGVVCTRTASIGGSHWTIRTSYCTGVTFSPLTGHQNRALTPSHPQTVQDITK